MSKKEEILKKINDDFDKMSKLVLTQLYKLEEVIAESKINILTTTYQEIFEREKEIDLMEISISNDIINALVLQHPAASNLRMLVSIQRMVVNLERVADLMMNIIEFLRRTEDNKSLSEKYFGTISNMLTISINMVKKALQSYTKRDKDYAIWTIKSDDVVDELYRSGLRNMLKGTTLDDKTMKVFYEFITMNNIISNIERIGDNASNIAEASIYFLEGKDMRHKSN